MKKIAGLLLSIMVLSAICPVMAKSIELTEMDYENLVELKQAVDMELFSRPEAEPRVLAPGKYIVGEDIKAGRYYATVNSYAFNEDCTSRLKAYETDDTEPSLWCEWPSLDEPPISIALNDGNVLSVEYFPITLSVEELSDDQKYEYVVPEGTYVSVGVYEVGNDIPAGSYQVYMGTIYGGDVFVYANDELYKEGTYETRTELRVIWDDGHIKPLSVQEGNIIVVKKDVVMRKQQQLTFE